MEKWVKIIIIIDKLFIIIKEGNRDNRIANQIDIIDPDSREYVSITGLYPNILRGRN